VWRAGVSVLGPPESRLSRETVRKMLEYAVRT
jgi:hypothetical protein